jgi:hypothetical protein
MIPTNVKVLFLAVGFVIVGAIVISVPILLILRLFPSYRRLQQVGDDAEAWWRERRAEYERAGTKIKYSFVHGWVISGNLGGVCFRHHLIYPEVRKPGFSAVSILTNAPGEFCVRPEIGFTEAAMQLGMVDGFQTGDASFDHEYYFSGSSNEYIRSVFGVRENRDRVRALFAGGFDSVEKSGKYLTAVKWVPRLLKIAEVTSAVEQLGKVRLPPVVPGGGAKWLSGAQVLDALRVGLLVFGLIAVKGYFFTNNLLDELMAFFVGVLPIAGAIYAATLAAAYFYLKSRSIAVPSRGALWGPLFALAIVIFGDLVVANEWFDTSTAEVHEARVVKRYVTMSKSKQTNYYYLEFESWRRRYSENCAVSAEIYALAREGQVWRVRTRSGLLGQVWVESMEPRT